MIQGLLQRLEHRLVNLVGCGPGCADGDGCSSDGGQPDFGTPASLVGCERSLDDVVEMELNQIEQCPARHEGDVSFVYDKTQSIEQQVIVCAPIAGQCRYLFAPAPSVMYCNAGERLVAEFNPHASYIEIATGRVVYNGTIAAFEVRWVCKP